ncbi:RebB family R body protein [Mucilaginibacter sp. Bleaf8]|nr:RebB family R body protein [Mucilaginibacter sp. Bleaf8]
MNSLQVTFQSMAVSIGIAMHNASTNQRNGQLVANACLSVCCKRILESQIKT